MRCVATQAYVDLDEIWEYVAADSLDAAHREFYLTIQSIAVPCIGHSRLDELIPLKL